MSAANLYCGRMTADGPCPQPNPCPEHPPVFELVDLETRMVTMSLAVLGELMDLAAQVEHFHEEMDAEAKERALERHWEILSGLGVNEREATELDDTVAVAGDQWRRP